MTTNYVDRVVWKLVAALPGCDIDLLRLYALLAMTKGVNTTAEHVHDAWSLWCSPAAPQHRSILPFDDLTPEVQALDDKYVAAIQQVAAELEAAR